MKIGILKGNGIGPEISESTMSVLNATGLNIEWVPIPIAQEAVERYGHPLPPEVITQLREVKLVIKAPLLVDKGLGRITCTDDDGSEITYPSLNNAIRRALKLFVNPRPIRGFSKLSGKYAELDMVIMREVTEDVYIGWEYKIEENAAQAIKLITRTASLRVARYAFDYARTHHRKKVTCLHKANVLNFTDGLFLKCCREVAKEYPDIPFDDLMIDAACYQLVKKPEFFDVVVAPNQYGDIFSDLGAGLIGSLGLAPGANIGDGIAVFEASHGAAPDIAGKGIANPIALILSGAELLDYISEYKAADAIRGAVRDVLSQGDFLTPDLEGEASTQQLTRAIAKHVTEHMQTA